MSVLKLGALLPSIPISTKPHKLDKIITTLPTASKHNQNHRSPLYTVRWRGGMRTAATSYARLQDAAPRIRSLSNTSYSSGKYCYYFVGSPFSSESGRRRGRGRGRGKPVARSAPSKDSSSSLPSKDSSSSSPFPPPPPPPPPSCSSSAGLVSDSNMGHESSANDVSWYQKDVPPSQRQQQQRQARLLTLPTILTLGRVAAVPVFVCTYFTNTWWGTVVTTSIFIAAAITDWLDGYIARKMRLGTAFGAFLDPVADKLMVAATLVMLCSKPSEAAIFRDLPWLLPLPAILIIGREITMSAVREWAASQNSKLLEAVAVNNLGKWKTATQMIALTILLASRDSSDGILVNSGVTLLYVSAGLAVWSLIVYGRKIWKVLLG